jgi:hypothetical protein
MVVLAHGNINGLDDDIALLADVDEGRIEKAPVKATRQSRLRSVMSLFIFCFFKAGDGQT